MRGFWSDGKWKLDGDTLLMPNSQRLALKDIVQWRSDVMVGRFDLSGKWPGWRVRQQFLIAPGGTVRQGCISEHTMKHLVKMHDMERRDASRRQLALF